MSTPMMMTNCPSEETLAAFIDGRLDPESRRRVVEHMSSCADCYSVISATWDLQAADPAVLPAPAPVVRGRFGSRTVWASAAAALAAAVVSFVFLYPLIQQRTPADIDDLVRASRSLEHRHSDGRLYGDFPHKPFKRYRGPGDKKPLSLQATAGQIEEAVTLNPSAENLHAFGAAQFLLGDEAAAAGAFENALRKETGERDIVQAVGASGNARLLSDLAGAYLGRANSDRSTDLLLALQAATRAWALDQSAPVAWNRALAIEKLQQPQAIAAWNDYLTRDSASAWADEARDHLQRLKRPDHGDLWETFKPQLLAMAAKRDEQSLRTIVAEYAPEIHKLAEEELFPRWAHTVKSGEIIRAGTQLDAIITIGAALEDTNRDSFLLDAGLNVRAHQSDPALANAFLEYAEGRQMYHDNKIAAAVVKLSTARRLFAAAHSPYEWLATVYVATCAYYRNDYNDALRQLGALNLRLDAQRYPVVFGLMKWVEGISHAAPGHLNEALASFETALHAFERAAHKDKTLAMMSQFAAMYDIIGDHDRAWRLRLNALLIAAELGKSYSRVPQTMEDAAVAALRDGYSAAALLFTEREIVLTADKSWAPSRVTALARRSELRIRNGDRTGATSDLNAAHVAADLIEDASVRDYSLTHPDVVRASLLVATDDASKDRVMHDAMAFAQATQSSYRRMELMLQEGRELGRRGDLESASQVLDELLVLMERERESLSSIDLRDAYLDERSAVYRDLVALALKRGRPKDALQYAERGRARTLRESFEANVPVQASRTIEALSARIPSDAVVVYYAIVQKKLAAWIMTSSGTRVVFSALEFRPAEVADAIMDDEASASSQAVADASAAFVAPWISFAAGFSTIVIIPDDELADFPFAALRSSDGLLIEHYTIVVAPSLGLYVGCTQRDRSLRESHRGDILLVGSPEESSSGDLQYLQSVATEIASITATYPRAVALKDDEATKDAFVRAAVSSTLIHYAGHGLTNSDNPSFAALRFRAGKVGMTNLYAHEIAAMKFPKTRLVVVSACDTLRGSRHHRGGVSGIGRAFIAAGVPVVIGAVRPVDDQISSALFGIFYARLKTGADPATALRLAQLEFSRKLPPSAWAAFAAVGGIDSKETSWDI